MATFTGGLRTPFARYWLSGFLADFGDGVRLAAFPLLAAQLTRSPAAVAAVTAVQGVPWLLLLAGLAIAGSQAGLGLTGNAIVAAAMLFISSAAWALFNMTALTMRQRHVPDALLGRVTSLFGTIVRSAEALGAIAGGVLAANAGIRAPMLAGAPLIAAAAAALAWRHRRGLQ